MSNESCTCFPTCFSLIFLQLGINLNWSTIDDGEMILVRLANCMSTSMTMINNVMTTPLKVCEMNVAPALLISHQSTGEICLFLIDTLHSDHDNDRTPLKVLYTNQHDDETTTPLKVCEMNVAPALLISHRLLSQ